MTDHGNESPGFTPSHYEPIGECVICGFKVYPANENEIAADEPVMHGECGW